MQINTAQTVLSKLELQRFWSRQLLIYQIRLGALFEGEPELGSSSIFSYSCSETEALG